VFDVTLTEDFQYDSRFDDADNIIQQYQWKKVQITEYTRLKLGHAYNHNLTSFKQHDHGFFVHFCAPIF
jgi:hypothetical protein